MRNFEKRSDCPISYALDFFGDKWTFLIIRDLAFKGKKFYKEFLNGGEGIATNILSDRLKRLEVIGVVESRTYEQQKTMKEYALTEKGKDLIPILVEIILWSAKYDPATAAGPEFVAQAKADKAGLIGKILADLG